MSGLHLTITTPMSLLVDETGVQSVRAEDRSGCFGILPGHTEFMTVLPASVLRWRTAQGALRFCALRSGLLTVENGTAVAVACREGVLGDDLHALEAEVETLRAAEDDADRRERVEQMRLHASAVRQLMQTLRPQRPAGPTAAAFARHPPGGGAS
ncbi:F0F1 ATP synthase subunit epsilon [Salipiger mangrovisoli]|uniref:ATP synthase epsilon chain n=1 Tax=Salipiger mangrovisoli TaxID=2865933 RepID=A0ABR9WYH3_9RHOB|nr:F0F1 ATP synthase subunit epsilon [Salipiger mangrovisoli]MBE9636338.1 F0F1 ATP synthase subunit epsilon [Salipiger mangrovisoli]